MHGGRQIRKDLVIKRRCVEVREPFSRSSNGFLATMDEKKWRIHSAVLELVGQREDDGP
jgi:hypothetical protein